jgi:hypothetical protein
MVAPNKLHHLFVAEYITSYPRAGVYAAPSLSKKRPDLCFNESQDGYGLLLAVKRIGPAGPGDGEIPWEPSLLFCCLWVLGQVQQLTAASSM